jgi:GT2 family glycosyltransferase/glycosyltransferase involved in cell wall biosynthesis
MRSVHVVHGVPPAAIGGVEVYAYALARALRDGDRSNEVVVLAREADLRRPELSVRHEERDGLQLTFVNNTFRDVRGFEDSYRNPAIQRTVGRFLDAVAPDVVHVHHLTGLSTDLLAECAWRRIPTLVTLNDYWLICHRGQLLDLDLQRCAGPEPDGCARCAGVAGAASPAAHRAARLVRRLERRLPARLARGLRQLAVGTAQLGHERDQSALAMARRVRHMRRVCGLVTIFFAPTRTIRDRFVAFGIDPDRILQQEQGIEQQRFRGIARSIGDRLRIGFLGSLMVSKAPHVLLEAFATLTPGAASVHLFGAHAAYHGDDSYQRQLAPLLARPGVHYAGPIAPADVPRALACLDVLVVPSVWIENAPFVIREAFAAGVPVIASDLGGMAEMVTHEVNGLRFSPGSAADLARALSRLVSEPGLLAQLREGIPPVKTIEEDAAWTRAVYQRCVTVGPVAAAPPGSFPGRPARGDASEPSPSGAAVHCPTLPRVAAVVLNYRTPDDAIVAVRALQSSDRPIEDVVVVDNGSADGSESALREHLVGVHVLQTGQNLGFSGGSNVGIRDVLGRADLVLLVNPDVVLPPDCIGHLEAALTTEVGTGIVGPVVLSRTDPDRVDSAGMSFAPTTGRMRHPEHGRAASMLGGTAPARIVDGVSGCAMLVRREVFERVGLLAEEYFFSFEDLDFCLRARSAGFLTVLARDALAYHEGSASIGVRSARRLYFATRNHLLLADRTAPSANGLGARARRLSIVGLNLAHAARGADVPRLAGLRAVLSGARDHQRRRYGPGS